MYNWIYKCYEGPIILPILWVFYKLEDKFNFKKFENVEDSFIVGMLGFFVYFGILVFLFFKETK